MKTSGFSCETKFGLLGFLGHSNGDGYFDNDNGKTSFIDGLLMDIMVGFVFTRKPFSVSGFPHRTQKIQKPFLPKCVSASKYCRLGH